MNRPHQSKAELAMRKAVKLRPASGGERFAAAKRAMGVRPKRPKA